MKNHKMPPLIYGTAWKKDKTADLVTKAIKYGFRGIDTACQPKHYNEAGVGEALQRLSQDGIAREDLYIQTKFTPLDGQDPQHIPYDRKAPLSEQVAQSFQASKRNLGVDYIDGLILHSPLENLYYTMTAWRSMEQIHHEGGTKQIGISNCYDLDTLQQIYKNASVKPTIVQNRFYRDTDYDHAIRMWCDEHQIVYQSFWTLTANPQILFSEQVLRVARTYQKTPAQIFFRVLVDIGIVPLTGTTSDQHMQEDLEIINIELQPSDIQEIVSLIS